jgi:anti-sigma factor RsiW
VDCKEYIETLLTADTDGELTVEEAKAASEHLVICPECTQRLASERTLKAFVRRRIPIVATPENVRRQINSELDRPVAPRSGARLQMIRPAMRWAPMAIAAVLLVIILFARSSQKAEIPAFNQAVASYVAMQENFLPTVSPQSGTTLGQHYNEWLTQQIGMPLRAWPFDKIGYQFVGGKTGHLPDGRPIVYTVYSGPEGEIICGYHRDPHFVVPPGGQTVSVHHFYRYKGMSICLSVEGDMLCILTSRMPLDDFIRAIKQVEA